MEDNFQDTFEELSDIFEELSDQYRLEEDLMIKNESQEKDRLPTKKHRLP